MGAIPIERIPKRRAMNPCLEPSLEVGLGLGLGGGLQQQQQVHTSFARRVSR